MSARSTYHPPPFLLAAGLAFWTVASERYLSGAILVLLVEGASRLSSRWSFDDREFERVTDLTSIGFVLFVAWQWLAAKDAGQGIIGALSWMPAVLAALVVMQRMSEAGTFPLSSLFWSLRRRRDDPAVNGRVSLDVAYFCHCLVAAACANPRHGWFLPLLAVTVAYAAWPARRTGQSPYRWLAAWIAVMATGYLLQEALVAAQEKLESQILEALRERWSGRADGTRTQTSIGEIGELKLSGRIVMRVQSEAQPPFRLRDAVYDAFGYDTWFARDTVFRQAPGIGERGWLLTDSPAARFASTRIAQWLDRGRGLLPLPPDTVRLEGLNVGRVEISRLGTVRVASGPDLVAYEARSADRPIGDSPPGPHDLAYPARLDAALLGAGTQAHAVGLEGMAAAEAVRRHFITRYRYTTRLTGDAGEARSLNGFLESDRAGHCEYFATAAALVLRRLGIPARYATGYVVSEYSRREKAYVVRARHAHAWTLAWIDGRWIEVDATPSGWIEAEDRAADDGALGDLLAWAGYRFTLWRLSDGEDTSPSLWWLAAVVPLAGWVLWGVVRRSRRTKADAATAGIAALPLHPCIASLAGVLESHGHHRTPDKSILQWFEEIPCADSSLGERLRALARDYDRFRFDPGEQKDGVQDSLKARADDLARTLRNS